MSKLVNELRNTLVKTEKHFDKEVLTDNEFSELKTSLRLMQTYYHSLQRIYRRDTGKYFTV